MNCDQVRDNLSLYIDGAMDEASLDAMAAHLQSCESCSAELNALRSLVSFAADIEDVDPPQYLKSAIKDAIAAEKDSLAACREFRGLLSAYLDGELVGDDVVYVEFHTNSCESCAEELRLQRLMVDAVRRIDEVRPPASLRSRIAAATTGGGRVTIGDRLRTALRSFVPANPKLGWAAGAVVIAAAALLMFSPPVRRQTDIITEKTPVASQKPAPVMDDAVTSEPDSVTTATVAIPEDAAPTAASDRTRRKAETKTVALRNDPRPELHKERVAAKPASDSAKFEESSIKDRKEYFDDDLTPPEEIEVDRVPVDKRMDTLPEPSSTRIRIAIAPTPDVLTEISEDISDIKVQAEMNRGGSNRLRLDVISSRF